MLYSRPPCGVGCRTDGNDDDDDDDDDDVGDVTFSLAAAVAVRFRNEVPPSPLASSINTISRRENDIDDDGDDIRRAVTISPCTLPLTPFAMPAAVPRQAAYVVLVRRR